MDVFDFYFRQIVTQGQMDWAFSRVQSAMYGIAADHGMTGIADGLTVTEHSTPPDKSVDVAGPGVAYDPYGRRCSVPDSIVVVNCAQDEFGTDSEPPTAGYERYISVFLRYDRSLTEPALDGNNITVYTKQLENYEIFVRLGTEASVGTAVPPPLMPDAILLADILVSHGFTAIINGDIDFSRRQDFVRYVGSSLGEKVYGTAQEGLLGILAVLESWSGGSLPFTFSEDWNGSIAVTGNAGPIDTITKAVNAIVYDLAQSSANLGGALIGLEDSPAWIHLTGWSGSNIHDAVVSIGDDLDGHIDGAAPQHPASSITTEAYPTMIFYVSSVGALTPGQQITSQSGATAIAVERLSEYAIRVRNVVGTFTYGHGVTIGGAYTTPDFYHLWRVDDTLQLTAVSAQDNLEAISDDSNARTRTDSSEEITAAWNFRNGLECSNIVVATSLLGGTLPGGTPEDLLNRFESDESVQCLPYEFESSSPWSNANTMCRGIWRSSSASDSKVVQAVHIARYDQHFVYSCFLNKEGTEIITLSMTVTVDAGGTVLPAADKIAAIARGGKNLYVLIDQGGLGTDSYLLCFDGKALGKFLWKTTLSGFGCGTAPYDRTRMIGTDDYCYMIFGAEDMTGDPLVMVTGDGATVLSGHGDWGASAGYLPSGGLGCSMASGNQFVWFTADNGGNSYLVKANGSCGSTGGSPILMGGGADFVRSRDLVCPGRWVICALDSHPTSTHSYQYAHDISGDMSGYLIKLESVLQGGYPIWLTFDGHNVWYKFIGYTQGATAGYSRPMTNPYHLSRYNGNNVSVAEPRYLISAPSGSSSVAVNGPCLAWAGGIWHLTDHGAAGTKLRFQAGAGLLIN